NKRLVMLKKRFVIFTISLSLAFAYGTCYAQSHTCNKLNWLMGEWIGEGTGKPGDGKGSFTFKEDLSGRILIRRNHSEYPPLGDKAGTVHDDLLVVYSDSLGNPSNAIYFDNEGHVINYHLSFTGSVCIFLSQKSDTFPVFKLTYTLTGPDVINIKFEMSQNGGNFITYTEGLCKRRTL
ncbi:MAG: hypothetical protein M3N30_10865, partial [Bacteroidota bacterium]|nr:hypothetical protein [Bacteroidota bacterium]